MTPLIFPVIEIEPVNKKMIRLFEDHMRTFGMFENDGSAMVKCEETGDYSDPDTQAMWCGFRLGYLSACDPQQGGFIPNWVLGTIGELK